MDSEAINCYNQLIIINPSDVKAFFNKGKLEFKLKKYD